MGFIRSPPDTSRICKPGSQWCNMHAATYTILRHFLFQLALFFIPRIPSQQLAFAVRASWNFSPCLSRSSSTCSLSFTGATSSPWLKPAPSSVGLLKTGPSIGPGASSLTLTSSPTTTPTGWFAVICGAALNMFWRGGSWKRWRCSSLLGRFSTRALSCPASSASCTHRLTAWRTS